MERSSISFCQAKLHDDCRFARRFYQTYSNTIKLSSDQTSLTIQPFYALSNQSLASLSISIIYRLAHTYLVSVPLLFECQRSRRIHISMDCDDSITDTRVS